MTRRDRSIRPLRRVVAGVGALLFVVVARPAAAEVDPSATWLGLPTWIWMLANLVIFFGILGYLLAPPITRFLEERGRRIRAELDEARERRAEAADLQKSLGAKIAELESQIDEILERADREGHHERDAILAQAEREKERLLSQAEGEIQHRLDQARQELKDFTAELAADLARERLENDLDPDARKRLFRRNLDRLEREAS